MERTRLKPNQDRAEIDKFLATTQPVFVGLIRSKRNVWGRRKPFIRRNERWLWQQEAARPLGVLAKVYR